MPPRVKITKEEIVSAALELVRKQGPEAVNARTVAAVLQCSTQPIFSNFATMEQLHLAVAEKAEEIYQTYMIQEENSGKYPAHKANGMAYIRFAKEEKELFKLMFMCDRAGDNPESELNDKMVSMVQEITGLKGDSSQLFHLEMWSCVHGIATMFATGYVDLPWELVSSMISHVYQGLRKQYGME